LSRESSRHSVCPARSAPPHLHSSQRCLGAHAHGLTRISYHTMPYRKRCFTDQTRARAGYRQRLPDLASALRPRRCGTGEKRPLATPRQLRAGGSRGGGREWHRLGKNHFSTDRAARWRALIRSTPSRAIVPAPELPQETTVGRHAVICAHWHRSGCPRIPRPLRRGTCGWRR